MQGRHYIAGTGRRVITHDGTHETFGAVEYVRTRPDAHPAAPVIDAGMIAKVEGGYIAFAQDDHDDAIGPEFSGGHKTRKAAALAAVEMSGRREQVRADMIAAVQASADSLVQRALAAL